MTVYERTQDPTPARGRHTCPPWNVLGIVGAALLLAAWLSASVQLFNTSQTNALWPAAESRQGGATGPSTMALELG